MVAISYKIKRLSGKHNNSKFLYYLKNFIRINTPIFFYQKALQRKLKSIEDREDADYIYNRVAYYNKLKEVKTLGKNSKALKSYTLAKKHRTYFFDSYEYTRYFDQNLRIDFTFGDINFIPEVPSIVKSRPIEGENENSVLLKLNKIRHFTFTNDKRDFLKKKDLLIGRMVACKESRIHFLDMYNKHPLCDIGQINKKGGKSAYIKEKITIDDHLDYKFILSLEGNDVASNLKWIMSSQSLAVMPKPCFETWFMEGTLIPNFHYIEIKADYSDLEERLNYYITHPQEALAIVKNANAYVEQFKNKKREDLISLLVLEKYFEKTK